MKLSALNLVHYGDQCRLAYVNNGRLALLDCLNKKNAQIFYHETKKVCFSLILPLHKRTAGDSVLSHPQAFRTDTT